MESLEQLGFNSSATDARRASETPVRCRSRSPRRSRRTSSSSRAVLSGNRNFEGRINPLTRFNYLASPPLVVAYALAGTDGHRLHAPSRSASATTARCSCATSGRRRRKSKTRCLRSVKSGDVQDSSTRTCSRATTAGGSLPVPEGDLYAWDADSTYVKNPPFFDGMTLDAAGHHADHRRARCSRCSAIRSRPITSRRPDRFRRRVPAGSG